MKKSQMKVCLPISAKLVEHSDKHGIGTCFLVRGKSEGVKLVTCAHLATEDVNFADLTRWPSFFSLYAARLSPIALALFATEHGPRRPTFQPLRVAGGVMADLVALPVPNALSGTLTGVRVFDLAADSHSPSAGEEVVSYGFPFSGKPWPDAEPNKMVGPYLSRRQTGAHEAKIGMQKGHSGGPVLSKSGKLIGMGIGQQGDVDRIIAVDVIQLLVR